MSNVITTNKLFDILNAELEKVNADENYHVNILLTGNDGSGRTNIVRRWFERKAIRYFEFTNPGLGNITNKEVLDTLDVSTFGVILRKVNSESIDPDFNKVSEVIETRKLTDDKEYDFSNLRFAVATVLPDNEMSKSVELPEAFLNKFTTYVVEPSLKETLEYLDSLYDKKSSNINRLKVKSMQGGRELGKITAFKNAQQKKLIHEIIDTLGEKDYILGAAFTPKKLELVFDNNNFNTVEDFKKTVLMEMKVAKSSAPEIEQTVYEKAIDDFKALFE